MLGNGWLRDYCCKAVSRVAHTADHPVEKGGKLFFRAVERSKSRHRVWVVEVPSVLRETDEVPDGRVGSPGATKRRTAQFRGNTLAQESGDVCRSRDQG